MTRQSSRSYTAEDVDRALLELAVCGGNSAATSRRLAEQGLQISDRKLRYWRAELYPERYHELAEQNATRVEGVILEQARETAILAAEVERQALARTAEQLEQNTLKDPSTAARNAATVKGINLDKVLALTGRPQQITEHRNPTELIRALVEKKVLVPSNQPVSASNKPGLLPPGDRTDRTNT